MDITRTTSKSKVVCSRVYKSDYQSKGTLTAEVKQVITTVSSYPTQQIDNDMQDNPFDVSDFGISTNDYSANETRVSWVDVPLGTTQQKMNQLLDSKEGCCLYKVLSNAPILTSNQKYAISQGLQTKASFAESQAVRHPETNELILDNNGNIQYRKVYYSNAPKDDVDMRTIDADKHWASESLMAELTGEIVEEQIIA